ncbi:MAG: hypothetical protein KKE31_02775, partial [Planctomycetes bacterium]|nr:hypothetical protein [Planctomycetota bacterium]
AEKAQSQPDQQTKKDATNNEGLMIPLLKKESAPSDESKDEAKSDEPKDETESDEPKDETKPDESKDETEKAE